MEQNQNNSAEICFGEDTSDHSCNQITIKSNLTDELELKVFFHSHFGFSSNSTLICGKQDAVLVSATFLLSDAHRLAAGILETGKNLTHIIIPEFHPDHHFGAGVLQNAFPHARVVATKDVAKDIVYSAGDKMELWGTLFGKQVPPRLYFPMPLSEDFLELEGHRLEITDGWQADMANETVIRIPSIQAVLPTDLVFYNAHVWTVETDKEERKQWKANLEKLRAMNPQIVVPGHVPFDGFSSDPDTVIDFTIQYLIDFDDILANVKTGDELVRKMEEKYPLKTTRFALHWQAGFLFPDSCSDHIIPVPGIFHAPGE